MTHFQSLTLDSKLANVRPAPPPSSKGVAGGATVAVDTLRVIRRIPSDAVCESVLYGMVGGAVTDVALILDNNTSVYLRKSFICIFKKCRYSRTPLIRPPSESHWCGRIRGMVAREGFVFKQKALSVTRNVGV